MNNCSKLFSKSDPIYGSQMAGLRWTREDDKKEEEQRQVAITGNAQVAHLLQRAIASGHYTKEGVFVADRDEKDADKRLVRDGELPSTWSAFPVAFLKTLP